jgi:hypothetical protein
VDVDGVLSLYGGAAPGSVVGTQVDGVPHLLSRAAGAVLASLAGAFECAWCTGWEERADEHLPALLDLPRGWPCLRFADPPSLDLHWKLSAIDAFAGPARPLAWIDDGHDASCRAWALQRPGPTLLVTTLPDVGLTAADGERLRAWAQQLAAR